MPAKNIAMKEVRFGGQLRFRLPRNWVETPEGSGFCLYQPERPDAGSLRVTTEVYDQDVDGDDSALAAATRDLLIRTAERFVRPDDPRGKDRVIEELDDGGIYAGFNVRTEIDGDRVMIYLWLRGQTAGRRVTVALFSYTLPAERDGEVPFVDTVAMLDREIREAFVGDL